MSVAGRVLRAAGFPVRALLIGLIRLYRVLLGPLLGGRCRFHPSCSAYAEEAIRIHGAAKGSALAAWRIARCTPLSDGGIDRVPARGHWRRATTTYDNVVQEGA